MITLTSCNAFIVSWITVMPRSYISFIIALSQELANLDPPPDGADKAEDCVRRIGGYGHTAFSACTEMSEFAKVEKSLHLVAVS